MNQANPEPFGRFSKLFVTRDLLKRFNAHQKSSEEMRMEYTLTKSGHPSDRLRRLSERSR